MVLYLSRKNTAQLLAEETLRVAGEQTGISRYSAYEVWSLLKEVIDLQVGLAPDDGYTLSLQIMTKRFHFYHQDNPLFSKLASYAVLMGNALFSSGALEADLTLVRPSYAKFSTENMVVTLGLSLNDDLNMPLSLADRETLGLKEGLVLFGQSKALRTAILPIEILKEESTN